MLLHPTSDLQNLPGTRSYRRFARFGLLLCTLFFVCEAAQGAAVPESKVNARYLVLFCRYVEWPPNLETVDKEKAFNVCVLGHDPFGNDLDSAFEGIIIDGKPVQLRRVESTQDALKCAVVFMSREETQVHSRWLQELQDKTILVVSDAEATLQAGASVVLVRERIEGKEKVRFDVNLNALRRAGLKISARMRISARKVFGAEETETEATP